MTVLRDGLVVGEGLETASLDEAALARLMLGASVDRVTNGRGSRRPSSPGSRALDLPGHQPLTLAIRRGEVVGPAGLPGTGFEQVPYLVSGARGHGGTLVVGKQRVELRKVPWPR